MPLLKKARIEVYLPRSNNAAYSKLRSAFEKEFLLTFNGYTLITELKGSYVNESGGVDRWGVEMGSPQSMVRAGWRSNIIKAGDTVTVVVNPLKSGEFGGIFVSITLPDGRKLGGRAVE